MIDLLTEKWINHKERAKKEEQERKEEYKRQHPEKLNEAIANDEEWNIPEIIEYNATHEERRHGVQPASGLINDQHSCSAYQRHPAPRPDARVAPALPDDD